MEGVILSICKFVYICLGNNLHCRAYPKCGCFQNGLVSMASGVWRLGAWRGGGGGRGALTRTEPRGCSSVGGNGCRVLGVL